MRNVFLIATCFVCYSSHAVETNGASATSEEKRTGTERTIAPIEPQILNVSKAPQQLPVAQPSTLSLKTKDELATFKPVRVEPVKVNATTVSTTTTNEASTSPEKVDVEKDEDQGLDEEQKPPPAEEEKPTDAEKPKETPKTSQQRMDDLAQPEDSNFLIFMLVGILLVVCIYLLQHNKKKILGLMFEGRGSRRNVRYSRLNQREEEQFKEDIIY